jgi:hypothetical protein
VAGSFSSCGEDDEWEDIPVEYVKCPCDNKVESDLVREFKDILMFDVSKTPQHERRDLTLNEKEGLSTYVYVDFEIGMAGVVIQTGNFITTFHICNFPVNKIPQTIPQNGLSVCMTGDVYEDCIQDVAKIPEYHDLYIVLTSLKIQQQ